MRSQGEIKRELIRLRWTAKVPIKDIADRAGVGVQQIIKAMQLEASESVLRRLDAFLDAKHLHVVEKNSRLLYEIERLSYELWRFHGQNTLPMSYIYPMPVEKQRRLKIAIQWRLKKLLREKLEKEAGRTFRIPDGANYWKLKEYYYPKGELRPMDRKPDRGKRTGSVG